MIVKHIDMQKKNKKVYALIYTTEQPAPFWRSTGCSSKSQARSKLTEIREAFLAEKGPTESANPEGEPVLEPSAPAGLPSKVADEKPAPDTESVVVLLPQIYDVLGPQWSRNTRSNYQRAGRVITEGLGVSAYIKSVRDLDALDWLRVREHLCHDIKDGSRLQMAGMVRRLTSELIFRGLSGACLHHLNNIRGKSQNEAAGTPFGPEELRLMRNRLKSGDVNPVLVGLVGVGLSAGPQMVDAGLIRYDEIDLSTGMVRRNRTKIDDAITEFMLLPEALEWVRSRHREGDVYVFPELVLTERERKQATANRVEVDISHAVKRRISALGTGMFSDFLKGCGIDTERYSFKSFRQHVVSLLSSLGVKEKLRMRLVGHQISSAHIRYDFPVYWEFERARDLLAKNLKAIDEGKNVRYILSFGEVVDELEGQMRAEFAAAEAKAARRHLESCLLHEKSHQAIVELRSDVQFIGDALERLVTILRIDLYRDKDANHEFKENYDSEFDGARVVVEQEPAASPLEGSMRMTVHQSANN